LRKAGYEFSGAARVAPTNRRGRGNRDRIRDEAGRGEAEDVASQWDRDQNPARAARRDEALLSGCERSPLDGKILASRRAGSRPGVLRRCGDATMKCSRGSAFCAPTGGGVDPSRRNATSHGSVSEYAIRGLCRFRRPWQGKAGGFGFQDRLGWGAHRRGQPVQFVGLPRELRGDVERAAVNRCAGVHIGRHNFAGRLARVATLSQPLSQNVSRPSRLRVYNTRHADALQ